MVDQLVGLFALSPEEATSIVSTLCADWINKS
jgi:hypothetical protein